MPQSTTSNQAPSIPAIMFQYFIPLILLKDLFLIGLLPTLRYMLLHPLSIPFPSAWHKSFLNAGLPYLLTEADKMYANAKRPLFSQAKGRVLEVGAGTGETIKYYDKSKIDVIYGVEPNIEALEQLRQQLVKNDIEEKYEILPFGVEDEKKMIEAGVFPESIDTIVCVCPNTCEVNGR
jgi:SAM-dependent methyltransferase